MILSEIDGIVLVVAIIICWSTVRKINAQLIALVGSPDPGNRRTVILSTEEDLPHLQLVLKFLYVHTSCLTLAKERTTPHITHNVK